MKTPTTIHQAMMEDIISNPSDLSLRLIYADYLCDSGSEDYGEFIQLSIGNGRYGLSQWEVRKWFGECLPEFHTSEFIAQQGTWWVVLKDKLNAFMTIELGNGFIEGFRGTLQAFHDHGPRLCQHQPVMRAKITDRQPEQNFPGYYYWSSSHNTQQLMETFQSPHFIPDQMMGMKHQKMTTDTRTNRLIGDTVDLVNIKLSNRLIDWSRSQPLTD